MIDVYREIVRLEKEGRRVALATVIATKGSTPRKAGAKMLVREDGSTFGTISGGCVEAEVSQIARQVLESGKPQVYASRLSDEEAGQLGLACGGTMRVWIERV